MKRILLAVVVLAASLAVAVMPVRAQDDPGIAASFVAMVAARDVAMADTIIHPDFTSLYPISTSLPGREAFKQRLASATEPSGCDSRDGEIKQQATAEQHILVWFEIACHRLNGETYVVPYFFVLVLQDGMIIQAGGAVDQEYYFDQMGR